MINVTKSFLPPFEEYITYLKGVWDRGHLTNAGPLVVELEARLRVIMGVKHFFLVNNGTIALQIALKALDLRGEVLTTPFSYVATTSSIVWENCTPVFVDIDADTLCLDPSQVEKHITPNTVAILATHVYGNPCDVDQLAELGARHNLKIIYDAAHAFGVNFNDKSILNYGSISTLSFHATKLFHTVEGGGIATNNDELAHRIGYMRNFGHNGPEAFWGVGVNGKNSEFHAAMGLAVLPHVPAIIKQRQKLSEHYDSRLTNSPIERPKLRPGTEYNYAYYPVIFRSEEALLQAREKLLAADVTPRRYFYPSLNTLPYLSYQAAPVSESVSRRVLCLPLYYDLEDEQVDKVCNILLG